MLIVIALLVVLLAVIVLGTAYRRRHQAPDSAQRVGDEHDLDPSEAARRAGGNNAWLRGDF